MLNNLAGFIRSHTVSLAFAGAGIALIDGVAVEPNIVRRRGVRVYTNHYSRELAGVRIAHLSDLHVAGRGWKASTIAASIRLCNEEDVDLIAITGDLVGGAGGAPIVLDMLSELRTDVPRFAVLGNHDHVYGRRYLDVLLRGLRELGIVVLDNESAPVELPAGRLWIVGVNDGYTMRDDLPKAFGSIAEDGYPRVLLTHYPEVAEQLRPGEVQLSLAGHSHAGQIRLPLLGTLMHNNHARTKYGKGLFTVNGNPLYVSAGVGMSGIPMRFRNLPEVPLISFVPSRPFPSESESPIVCCASTFSSIY